MYRVLNRVRWVSIVESNRWIRRKVPSLGTHENHRLDFGLPLPLSAASNTDLVEGFTQVIEEYLKYTEVIVVGSVPSFHDLGDPLSCYFSGPPEFSRDRCAIPREDAITPAALELAAQRLQTPLIDPQEILCSKNLCYSIFDEIPVYRDQSHLTSQGAMRFTPLFLEALHGLGSVVKATK